MPNSNKTTEKFGRVNTKLIVGLGNPGKKYEHTRHNIGFRVLDALARNHQANFIEENKFKSLTSSVDIEGKKIILVKPQTFMNESGEAVQKLLAFYKLPATSLLVVHDEIDLPLGKTRLSFDVSSAGHNGIKSIIENIGQDFHRLRIGVDTRKSRLEADTYDYVLQNFTDEEEGILEKKVVSAAVSEIEKFLQ